MHKVLLLIASCFTITSAQFPIKGGKCPDFNKCRASNILLTNEKVTGMWYIAANIPFFWSAGKKCTFFNYTALSKPNTLHLTITEYDNLTEEKRVTESQTVYTPDGTYEAKYTNLLMPLHYKTLLLTDTLWIRVICYECGFFGSPPGTYVLILTRTAFPNCDDEKQAKVALEKCGICKDALIWQNQRDCDFCRKRE